MRYLPGPVKIAGRKMIKEKDRIMSRYWDHVLKTNPEKHAIHEMKREKQRLIRPVNLYYPVYFHEKMLWLKYFIYNTSPLVAQCYNKYEVRNYVKSKGLGHILNELYGVWNDIESIPWKSLPEEYVMKISNGYSGHVFKKKGQPFCVQDAVRQLKEVKEKYSYYYFITGDLFVGKTPQYIICEKLLHSPGGDDAPEDYKFHCFNGKPMYIEIIMNRNQVSGFNSAFVDLNFRDRHELEGLASTCVPDIPESFQQMVEIAKVLSEDFPYVRVDLYEECGQPVFGELTFTPFHLQTKQSQKELGKLLDISHVERYTALSGKAGKNDGKVRRVNQKK